MVSSFRLGDVNDNEEKSSQKVSERAETPGCFELLIVTAKQMRKKKQFLLIPLTIWSGLEQGFFGADFTAVRYLHIFKLVTEGSCLMRLLVLEKICISQNSH